LISFANLWRITWPIEKGLISLPAETQWIVAPPQALWRLLKNKELDLAFISLLDFFRWQENLAMTTLAMGIAAESEVKSVLYFYPKSWKTTVPSEAVVHLDPQSVTSNALLKILIGRGKIFPEVKYWRYYIGEEIKAEDSYFLIGDKALMEKSKSHSILDLGTLWHEYTGLPFTYAVLCGWKGSKALEDRGLTDILKLAEAYSFANQEALLEDKMRDNPLAARVSPQEMKDYLYRFRYPLEENERYAMECFAHELRIY
jgi:chorismate dehydratase